MARLRVTIGLVVVLVATLGLAQRGTRLWPVVTWPVYSENRPLAIDSTTSLLEVRARTRDGRTHVLRADDLVEPSRHRIADATLEGAVDGRVDRAYLLRLVDIAVDRDVERAELWQVTWRVDPSDVPPLDHDRPASEHRLVVLRPDVGDANP